MTTEAPSPRPPRRRPALWASLCAAAAVALLVAVLATRPSAQTAAAASPLVGQTAPGLTGPAIAGVPPPLSALRGRFVLVNFFASWCVPCHTEEPELVQLDYAHRRAADLALVGVAFDDPASSARQFLVSSGAVWPAVADPGGRIALAYGVRGPPESFLVDRGGVVVAHFVGPVTEDLVDHYIDAARAKGA